MEQLLVSVAVLPAPVRVLSQRPLAPNVASVMSFANDKGDNEMILGAVHKSALQLRKTSARRPSDEGAVRSVIASNEVPFLLTSSVGLYSMGERWKERMGRCWMYTHKLSLSL